MANEETFLGEGWSFPPHFDRNTGSLVTTTGVVDINKSLEILLSTKLGERVMLPSYGCNLEDLLFQPLDITLKTYIRDLIKTAILYHEPILIEYIVRTTNSRANMVFPFYKVEGSEV